MFSQSKETEKPFFSPALATIQPKLTIGQPNDKYEQEADTMSERVVQKLENPNPIQPIQRKCEECEQEEKLQKKEEDTEEMEVIRKPIFESGDDSRIQTKSIESQLNASKGKGKPLTKEVKSNMESVFGADFSTVKIHTDTNAIQMNQDLNARAFTNSSDIYFNRGEYNPSSTGGKLLLAHELVHTIQQKRSSGVIMRQAQDWYRGTGVGVSPDKANTHDLGKGFYLTDTKSVADQYAHLRAPKPGEERVFRVKVDFKKLKGVTLDLTKDARWQEYLKRKIGKKSIRELMRIGGNYNSFFKEFVREYKINLSKYKIIIADEVLRGGKQMVVRDTKLQTDLVKRFVRITYNTPQGPGGPAASSNTPRKIPPQSSQSGTIRSSPRRASTASAKPRFQIPRTSIGRITPRGAVKGTIGLMAVSFVMDYLANWGIRRKIKKEFKKIEPEVAKFLSNNPDSSALIILYYQEWEHRDNNGNRAQMFISLRWRGTVAKTKYNAIQGYRAPGMKAAPPKAPKGWRIREEFDWIPSINSRLGNEYLVMLKMLKATEDQLEKSILAVENAHDKAREVVKNSYESKIAALDNEAAPLEDYMLKTRGRGMTAKKRAVQKELHKIGEQMEIVDHWEQVKMGEVSKREQIAIGKLLKRSRPLIQKQKDEIDKFVKQKLK